MCIQQLQGDLSQQEKRAVFITVHDLGCNRKYMMKTRAKQICKHYIHFHPPSWSNVNIVHILFNIIQTHRSKSSLTVHA